MAPKRCFPDGPIPEGLPIYARIARAESALEPAACRKSIAKTVGSVDREAQRDLAERIAILPRHIHAMAQKGMIAASFSATLHG
jgi:hypothetical protein